MEKDKIMLDIQFFGVDKTNIDYGNPKNLTVDNEPNDDDIEEETEEENDDDSVEFEDDVEEEEDDKDSKDSKDKEESTDKKEDEKPKVEEEPKEEVKKQSRDENSKYAQMRRDQERINAEKELAKQEGIDEGIRQAYNNVNKFTNKTLTDKASLETFKTMLEMDKKGLDPITDYADYIETKQRDAVKAKEKEEADKDFFIKDGENFRNAYPNVSLDDLDNDKIFNKLAKGRIGKDSLVDIYKDYLDIKNEFKEQASIEARKAVAKSYSSPKQIDDSSSNEDGDYYTLDQLRKMSDKDLEANWEKVDKSYEHLHSKKSK